MKPRIRFKNNVPVNPKDSHFDLEHQCYCWYHNAQESDVMKHRYYFNLGWTLPPIPGTTLQAH